MLKNKFAIILILFLFLISTIIFVPFGKFSIVNDVISPTTLVLDFKEFDIKEFDSFDSFFTDKNLKLANKLNISEEEAFLMGNLGKYWAENLMKNRKVLIKDDSDLFFLRNNYKGLFYYSGFCLVNDEPCFKEAFDLRISEIRRANFVVLDLDTDKIYNLKDEKIKSLKNFLIIRKSQIPKKYKIFTPFKKLDLDKIKVYFSDSSENLIPTRKCSTSICKEILNNINNSKESIDIVIYGYSFVPEIENAIKSAIQRGVKVRLVYDLDSKGKNIYPNMDYLVNLIPKNNHDGNSPEANSIMHNKFYIFDNKVLITGSANLSHTDMSGFNSNSIIVVDDVNFAKIFKTEFEQMYSGKFHNDKLSFFKNSVLISDTKLSVYFSPQDKALTNIVLPLIKNAKNYIYIPTFVLTEKRIAEELINAKKRGVEVKIILDALNGTIRHSKHNDLRVGNIEVKTENFAGKMHSKSMIIDDKFTIIGSMNFSNSGENKNDENLVVIENPKIAMFYRDFFLYQWNKIDDKWLKLNVRAEGKDSIGSCSDGIDNNYDGLIDLNDPACK